MKVRHLWDGEAFTLYALEFGDEHDYRSFRETMLRERPQEMATMFHRLERLANHGITSKTQNFNDLGDGLWEAKTSGGLRVTFFRHGPDIFVLDTGFAKKTSRTRPADLRRAQGRREQFLKQMAGESKPTVLVNKHQPPRRKLT